MSAEAENWHTLSAADVAQRLNADLKNGLAAHEVERRRREHGPNRLAETATRSRWSIFAGQFKSLIMLLLAVAAAVAFSTGDHLEGASIVGVITLNVLIGFLTEAKAERAIAALKRQATPTAHVARDGQTRQIPAEEIVPGDRVLLAAGDRVPADGRLIEQADLQLDEAALTGESHPVEKNVDATLAAEVPLGDRANMAYLGTAVTRGRGVMLVTAIGAGTEMGRIGKLIESARRETTPLQKQLHHLGRTLIVVVAVLCAIVAVVGRWRGHEWLEMFEVAVSLAVAAVPEGLPAVATVTLAIGVQRMARQRALIRHLSAVETLGSTTVICTDKTGTLTRNEMMVAAYAVEDRRIEVTGSGYEREGEFRLGGKPAQVEPDSPLAQALRIGALCNDARVERAGNAPKVTGDPTEAALLVAAEKAGWELGKLAADHPRREEIPFSSETKLMATIHDAPNAREIAFVKGAPAAILERSTSQLKGGRSEPFAEEEKKRWSERNRELAGEALRVLALAFRELPAGGDKEAATRELTFVGLVGMIDPLRPETRESIDRCRTAGVRVVMLTGDQSATATEIARQLGLSDGSKSGRTVNAQELATAGDDWSRLVADASVFARVNPEHKLRIVEALQQQNEIVAMTGDGVNDAPALKKANIGAAMGIKGTDVAKETADMIVTDDNFASIVAAIEQGRIIYGNIRKFIHYLFSCNLSEILTVFIALAAGWPLPLAPLQILWLNLITDVFPALALAFEPASGREMTRPPRDPNETLVNRRFGGLILWQAVVLAAVTLGAFFLGMRRHGADEAHAGTMAFMTLALAQTLHALNTRSVADSIFGRRLFANPWLWSALALCFALQAAAAFVPFLQRVLRLAPLTLADWAIVAAGAVAPLLVVEAVKFASRASRGR